jgi:drug/metabolite transporter (DMT)-like permease
MPTQNHALTYLKLILTAFFWGGTWVAAHTLVKEVPPFTAAFIRFAIATTALAWFLYRTEGRIKRLNRMDFTTVFWLGTTGIFLYSYCFLTGLKHISAGRGALVIALNPVLIALVSWLWFNDKMSALKATGIITALLGCILVISDGQPERLLQGEIGIGEILILGCVVSWTMYTFISRRATQTLTPLLTTFYASLVGCLLLGLVSISESPWRLIGHFSLTAWGCIIYLALFGTAIAYTWFSDAVRVIGAARAAPFINLVPISGVLLGALILDERLDWMVLVGGVITIAGVLITWHAGRLR